MRQSKAGRNPLLDKVLVGPLEAARLWGYESGRSFKRKLPELQAIAEIRSVRLLRGTFYVLEDVLKARHPSASQSEIQDMVKEHQEGKIKKRQRPIRHQWIGTEEAVIILNVSSAAILDQKLREFPKILTAERDGQTHYALRDCFRAAFREVADEKQLDQIIIEYKKQRLQKGINQHENYTKEQVYKRSCTEA